MPVAIRRALLIVLLLLIAGGLLRAVLSALPPVVAAPSEASSTESQLAPTSVRQDGSVLGMTVSCQTWGWEWGSDAMVDTLRELAGLGVNWVAIHPYASIRNDGSVSWREIDPAAPPDWIARPIREAHALGMKILIKPHIAYWGSSWDWRGAIEFDTPAQRTRFFADYTRWIEQMASASVGADAFAVGTELDRLLGFEDEWRRIIGVVKTRYTGPLTYAANWTDYDKVPFWDALDAIGVQAYFRLVPESSGVPSDAELDRGWDRVLVGLRRESARVGKPVVFTELGYNLSAKAAVEPWKYDRGGKDAEAIQVACMRSAVRAIDREPVVVGAFLWKWFPGSRQPRDFAKSSPRMRAVIGETWGGR